MTLAPAERRVLATIEDSLDRSDPRLARMLTQFTTSATWAAVLVPARGLRQLRPRITAVAVVIVAFLVILAVLRSPAAPLRCAAPSGPAATQAGHCPPPRPAGYAGAG